MNKKWIVEFCGNDVKSHKRHLCESLELLESVDPLTYAMYTYARPREVADVSNLISDPNPNYIHPDVALYMGLVTTTLVYIIEACY
jgi:hypothetical protein